MTGPSNNPPEPLLVLEGLSVRRPDGVELLAGVDLEVRPGEVIALLGGSGAGKSTLLGCIEDPEALRQRGFVVEHGRRELRATVGIVPQRGALFDHLSVGGNLRLALRHADEGPAKPAAGTVRSIEPPAAGDGAVEDWLGRMHLPREWASDAQPSTRLSGGEAQRVAVARTLAGGRRILFLDEPSVGLDPYRVLVLASLLREQIRERGAAAIVITHDLAFAAAFADRFWYMDRGRRGVDELRLAELPPEVSRRAEDVWRVEQELGEAVLRRLEEDAPRAPGRTQGRLFAAIRDRVTQWLEPFAVPVEVVRSLPASSSALRRSLRDVAEVLPVVLKQTLLRPAPFFAIVSTLIGYSVLYIFHRAFADGDLALRDGFVFTMLGSRHVIALAPPLAGILFCATSGNAITAWLGGISLTRQAEALQGLGVSPRRYLWAPAWVGLSVSSLLLSSLFVAGMVAGGTLYIASTGVESQAAYELITAQLLDPAPGDRRLLARAGLLLAIYAVGISADAVAKGAREKHSAEAVTASMVRSVMASTLWIVALELLTLPLVLR